ncbi:MAG TPA: cytochrome P450 [Anaerolineae bacterium]|nr:cytochrome P450 [Anaerolineae bacterium]
MSEIGGDKLDVWALPHLSDPYSAYRQMREQDPLNYSPATCRWRLTRHADITAVLRDERFGFTEPVLTLPMWNVLAGAANEAARRGDRSANADLMHWLLLQRKVFEMRQLWILLLNPPAHTRLRGLVQPDLNVSAVARWSSAIQATADALVDRLPERGEMDLIRDFAAPLTLAVTLQVLGIPPRDHAWFAQLSNELGHFLHAESTPVNFHRMGGAAIRLTEYFQRLIQERREPYGEDVIGTLIRAYKAGKLNEDELLANSVLLAVGGHTTTRPMLGNAMRALLQHRDQWRLLHEQPELVSGAVEECLRYDVPAQIAGRRAFADVNLNGATIKKGEWVNLILGAGNRDPEAFPEPERFDITRSPNPHLAFGHGIHYCLGAHLARATARIAFSTLARRLPQLALREGALEQATTQHLRGLKALPVIF